MCSPCESCLKGCSLKGHVRANFHAFFKRSSNIVAKTLDVCVWIKFSFRQIGKGFQDCVMALSHAARKMIKKKDVMVVQFVCSELLGWTLLQFVEVEADVGARGSMMFAGCHHSRTQLKACRWCVYTYITCQCFISQKIRKVFLHQAESIARGDIVDVVGAPLQGVYAEARIDQMIQRPSPC